VKALAASERQRGHYRDWYTGGGSEWWRIGAVDKADNVIALCGALGCREVLEIGAGEGAVLARLSELGFGTALHAVEISPGGVAAMQRRAIPRLVEARLYDGGVLPHPDGRFDLAILSHVLEHVEHPRQLLHEAARVARHVFVEVPTEDTLRLPADFVFDDLGHINTWSPRTIRRLVQSCGLRVLRQITTCPGAEVYAFHRGLEGRLAHAVKRTLLALAPAVATRVFTYHTALVCTALPVERETA
jgi:SAM-dependent methyltransferase